MSPTILVIDDNPKVYASFVLAFPEYQFIKALNGEDGIAYLQKTHEVDLVILDYKLGGVLDGLGVLKEIRREEPGMNIILLTSFGSKEVMLEALRGHADDFVEKPYSVDEMKKKMEYFFEKKEAEDARTGVGAGPMQRVRKLVERNYGKSPTLKEASEKILLSPKYISRKFKQETNQTFSDYKINLRIDQAKKLLSSTSQSVSQIAYKVGYENAESFMKMFKKILGCTPTEYRRKENER